MIHIYKTLIHFDNVNKMFHRLNGPAFITMDRESWYKNGKRHRLNGPAVIKDNSHYWYIDNYAYNETDYYNKLKEMGLG